MVEELKFKSIEIKSFRGIKDLTLNLENKSLVICGPNGTGKSSIAHAFEFLFTKKISALQKIKGNNHYIHEGDNKEDLLVKAKIGDKTIERTWTNEEGFEEFGKLKEDFKNGSFILNRKKLLSFTDTRPRERYGEIANLISFDKYDMIEKVLKKGRDDISKDKNKKEEKINSLYEEISSYYHCDEKEIMHHINNILKDNGFEEIQYNIIKDNDIEEIQYETDLKEFMKENNIVDSTKLFNMDISEINEKYLRLLEDYEELIFNELKSAHSLFTILNETKDFIISEKLTKCPVCQNHINSKSLIDEINPQIDEIKKDLNSFDKWKIRNDKLIGELLDINYELKLFNSKNDGLQLDYDLTILTESLKQLSNYEKNISEMDKEILFKLEEDVESLKEHYDLNKNELSGTLDNIFKLIEIEEIKKDKKIFDEQLNKAELTYNTFVKVKMAEIEDILENIIGLTAKYYNSIHYDDDIKDPDMKLTRSTSLDLKLYFGEKSSDPRKFSSEGHIDSLGLCIFLAFAKTYNKYGFLILDDIISTVDLEHKEQIITLLFEEFCDYTFIITTHNKLWFEQLSRFASAYNKPAFNFVEITKWDKYNGPKLSNFMTSKEIIDDYIEEGNIEFAGNSIRKYFEDVLHNICVANNIPLPILKHYSANDYHSPLKHFQKTMFKGTEYESYYGKIFKDLEKVIDIGNKLSHRNESSKDLRLNEIIKYRDAVYGLEKSFKCEDHENYYLKFDKDKKIGFCTKPKCDNILFLKSKPEKAIESDSKEEMKNIFISKGLDFIKQKEYKKALKSFDKAMEYDEDGKDILSYKLICDSQLNNEDDVEKYEEAFLINDEEKYDLNNIINIYLSLENPDKTLTFIDKISEKNDEIKEFKAILLYRLERYGESIEVSDEILLNNPNNLQILNIMGLNYIKLEKYEEAIKYLLKSYNINSENIEIIDNLALAYYSNDDFENAYFYLNESLKMDENNENTLELLTHTCLMLKKYEETINFANKLLDISDNNPNIFNDIAIVYFELGDPINGFNCLSLAAIAKETEEGYWISKGSYLSLQGKLKEAEKCFGKASTINQDNANLYIARISNYKKMGDEKKAKGAYNKLLSLNPNYSISLEDM